MSNGDLNWIANFNVFSEVLEDEADSRDVKLTAKRLKLVQTALAEKDEKAEPVVRKMHKPGKAQADPLYGLYEVTFKGKSAIVEFEPDTDLRDTEQVPLSEEGGIEAFVRREVLPYEPCLCQSPRMTNSSET